MDELKTTTGGVMSDKKCRHWVKTLSRQPETDYHCTCNGLPNVIGNSDSCYFVDGCPAFEQIEQTKVIDVEKTFCPHCGEHLYIAREDPNE